jgi:alanine dehydrogenase
VWELASKGHRVVVETGAGQGAEIGDDDYLAAGAEIVAGRDEVFDRAELIPTARWPRL